MTATIKKNVPPTDKRYQVFVSSTYEDLQSERQEVMHALLELDCIPAGMELFPAADDDQWTLIKKVIDDCDYYIVIIGGRYGSVGNDGISYTEREYRYALEIGKPIIAFIHREPGEIPANKTEQTEDGKKKLEAFKELTQKKACKYWTSPAELGSVVSRSIIHLIKSIPATGWIKADQMTSIDATKEILKLRQKVDELQDEINKARITAPKGSEQLAQGDDEIMLHLKIHISSEFDFSTHMYPVHEYIEDDFKTTWNYIFGIIAPKLIDECAENYMKSYLEASIGDRFKKIDGKMRKIQQKMTELETNKMELIIEDRDFQIIRVQLRALGLINLSLKRKRHVEDNNTYWTLTPYGDEVMNRLTAIRKA
jgi:hypothetical protein